MTKKFFLLIILSMFFISSLTLFLILNYLDPYRDEVVSIFTLAFSFTIFITSFFSIIFYILKKVYYRGEVFLSHIFSSLRQAFFLAIFILWIILFKIIWVFSLLTILLFAIILVFIEMIFQNF